MNELKLKRLIRNKKMSEKKIEQLVTKNKLTHLDWVDISLYQQLSEDFIDKYSNELEWTYISTHQKMSATFIIKHMDKIKWNWIQDNPQINHEELEEKGVYLIKKMMG